MRDFLGSPRQASQLTSPRQASQLTSPRQINQNPISDQSNQQGALSVLSPRNFLKLISSGWQQIRTTAPNAQNYSQFVQTFQSYLAPIREQYARHRRNLQRGQDNTDKNYQLQMQLKLNRIPSMFFQEKMVLQLGKRAGASRRQQQLAQYLDSIQLVLFAKSGKYPDKSRIILQNLQRLDIQVIQAHSKIACLRSHLKQKLCRVSNKLQSIRRKQNKINTISQTINNLQLFRKMKNLKAASQGADKSAILPTQQILIQIRKSDLQMCARFKALRRYGENIEQYRRGVKQRIYEQFIVQIQALFSKLLRYDKQEWRSIKIPSAVFVGQQPQADDVDQNNSITILDQSYFAFAASPVKFKQDIRAIDQVNQYEPEAIDMGKLWAQWQVIRQLDLYDQGQLNESLLKALVRHNATFTHDMDDYVQQLHQSSIRGKGQSLASLRGKQEQLKGSTQQKLSGLQMRLYLKVVRFYFSLLRRVLNLIANHSDLQFLVSFRQRLAQFLQERTDYFLGLKKVEFQMPAQDFLIYLGIIEYWQQLQFQEMFEYCERTRRAKIQEYLTNIQKQLLIKELKQTIEQSNYLPVTLASQHYPLFQVLLSQPPQLDMSVTLNQALGQGPNNQNQNDDTLRIINQTLFFKQRSYKLSQSFLDLAHYLTKYQILRQSLPEFSDNLQEKMCEIIGFYVWFNGKNITSNRNTNKTLKNYCTHYTTLLLTAQVIEGLGLTAKRGQKTITQLQQEKQKIGKTITMTPFMMIQQKISKLYESRITTRPNVPTPQSQRIIQLFRIALQCLKQYFPLQHYQTLSQSKMVKFLQQTIKLISKNYFGYLVNMEKRGLMEVRWFVPQLKELLEMAVVGTSTLKEREGTVRLFGQEIDAMENTIKQRGMGR